MLVDTLKDNIRLLERLTIFKDSADAVAGPPGSPERLFLSALQRLQSDDIAGAEADYKQLAAVLHVAEDSQQLEPLRTILHLKLWQGGAEGKTRLQEFLTKELGFTFEDGPSGSQQNRQQPFATPGSSSSVQLSDGPARPVPAAGTTSAQDPPGLPSHISPEQYSTAAFQQLHNSSKHLDPSMLVQAVTKGQVPLDVQIELLKDGRVPPAVLPVECLVKLVSEWLGQQELWAQQEAQRWVKKNWNNVTANQAAALRPLLQGPPSGADPDIDRPYIVACITKALAGAPAAPGTPAAPAAGSAAGLGQAASGVGTSGADVLPWQVGAEAAAAAAQLERVLAACDALGPPAEWIRVHALYAQLQLQQKQQFAVDPKLLMQLMQLLQRCTWSHGGPFGSGQQRQQPQHIACAVCGMQPIQGSRYRSKSQFEFNVCGRCASSEQAKAAGPLEEVKTDDSIYMLPEEPLPEVLQGLPADQHARNDELRKLIKEVVLEAAVSDSVSGPGALAGGLQLPRSSWCDLVVAEAQLMSGNKDGAEKWARLYQERGGDLTCLQKSTELAFAPHSRTTYALHEDVVLQLHTKNAGTQDVLVKVYELNCWTLYTSTQAETDLNLELSGVAPTKTLTIPTPTDPIIRSRHSVLLGLSGVPGVWLVEVVAGSKRLRARIMKGGLRVWTRPSVAGQVLTVMDEEWRPVEGVRIWCQGKEYAPQAPSSSATASSSASSSTKTTPPSGTCNEVLLPYAREQSSTALIVAAQLPRQASSAGSSAAGVAAGAAARVAATAADGPAAASETGPASETSKECVVLLQGFERLQERYCLAGQLYCHQEALLPGQTVHMVLQLFLQLHGRPAPLTLLQDLQLNLTANIAEGRPVTQVFSGLAFDQETCSVLVPYSLPVGATSLSAFLTARLLLTLPGVNGEPEYQDFELNALLPGKGGLQNSIEIAGAAKSSDIWDIYLTAAPASAATGSSSGSSSSDPTSPAAAAANAQPPEYLLQVLGRGGEAPAAPKTLSVQLDHICYSPEQQLHFKLQTSREGTIRLGHLRGIRQVRAQILSGVDYVDLPADHDASAAGQAVAEGGTGGSGSGSGSGGAGAGVALDASMVAAAAPARGTQGSLEEIAGPWRSWQVARASWWQGGLQQQYTLAEAGTLELPITSPAGQTFSAILLQLVNPNICPGTNSHASAAAAAVAANISTQHLKLLDPAAAETSSSTTTTMATTAAAAGGSGGSVSVCSQLGSGRAVVVRVQGLAVGLYRLILPGVAVSPPDQGCIGTGWRSSGSHNDSTNSMAVHIYVLPRTAAASDPSEAAEAGPGSSNESAADADADVAEPASKTQQIWLYADESSRHVSSQLPALVKPSIPQQLHILSFLCSVTSGLSVQLTGSPELLQAAQLIIVFSRFLPDGSIDAAQLLPAQLPWGSSHSAFGFSPNLELQQLGWGFGSGNEQGLGYDGCPQACRALDRSSYSQAARLDSAVAYVLQRRQWEASGGGRRPGMLLDRPSLLVFPRCVRSAAVETSVLRGGDGGRLVEAPHKKVMTQRRPLPPPPGGAMFAYAAAPVAACAAPPFPACYQQQQQMGEYCISAEMDDLSGATAAWYRGARPAPGARTQVGTKTPVLSFLGKPAAVLAGWGVDQHGRLTVSAEQLQQLLQEVTGDSNAAPSTAAAAAAAAEGSNVRSGSGSSGAGGVWDAAGFRVAYVAAYVPKQPAQFCSAWCAVEQQQHAVPGEGQSNNSSSLPAAALRDLGLDRPVDPRVVSALSCDVAVLSEAGSRLTLENADAAEAGVYGSIQQLYRLLAGLLGAAETGSMYSIGGCCVLPGLVPEGLPRAFVLPGEKEAASALLRQWEPLLLHWPSLSSSARQELITKLASAELSLFLALRDPQAYEQLLLPLLKCKIPSELSCLEQVLLLQATHKQPPIPLVAQQQQQQHSDAAATAAASAGDGPEYLAAKQRLLQHWHAPHRYRTLNCFEQLLLAALEGQEALLRFSQDLMQQLQSPAEKWGVKRTWMTQGRRALFEYALLLARELEQQQADGSSEAGTEAESDTDYDAAAGDDDTDTGTDGFEFVKVEKEEAPPFGSGGFRDYGSSRSGGAAPPARPMARMMAMAAPPPGAMGTGSAWGSGPAADLRDLEARARVAEAANSESALARAPKETKEWAESGWWKCNSPQPRLIPAARFWADYALHLATKPPGTPFIPLDPTDVASSTAFIMAALAVTGLPWEGCIPSTAPPAAVASAEGGSGSRGRGQGSTARIGCSRSYIGSSLTLTAKLPCLLWLKVMKPVAQVGSTDPAGSSSGSVRGVTSGTAAAAAGAAVSHSVMVIDRLLDPRFVSTSDPETGEEVLLALQPSQQQPLLAGQRYCRSVVITSSVAAERELAVLIQLPQGALSLAGSSGTISRGFKLAPYSSWQVEQTFYFPHAGTFKQAPVSVVTSRGRPAWLPSSPPEALYVVDARPGGGYVGQFGVQQPQHLDPALRWAHFIKSATPAQILHYLKTDDLSAARLADLSTFCRDPAFFSSAVAALSSRHKYVPAVWKWAVFHLDGPALRQLLPCTALGEQLKQRDVPMAALLDGVFGIDASSDGCSGSSSCAGSITVDAGGGAAWELEPLGLRHLEYWPWINPYCRPFTQGGNDTSLPSVLRDNRIIAAKWKCFLMNLLLDCSKAGLSADKSSSKLTLQQAAAAAVFLLLQDRIDEAEDVMRSSCGADWLQDEGQQEATAGAQPATLSPLRMQVDYLRAWLALCRPLPSGVAGVAVAANQALRQATAVVQRYNTCMAAPWNKRFKQLKALIEQMDQQQQAGEPAADASKPDADGEPVLTVLGLDGSLLKLQTSGLRKLQLAAYQIDTELLFTTQPFSNFSSSSSSTATARGVSGAQSTSAADGGLGMVSYVQPTANVAVQLSKGAGTGAAGGAPTTGSTIEASVVCSRVAVGAAGGVGAPSSSLWECVLDLNALLPSLKHQSVLLEVTGGGLSRSLPRFASSLLVHVLENQGLLQANFMQQQPGPSSSSNSSTASSCLVPAAAVYVKVFARDKSGDEFFYKDGYTDLRGKFDYVTLTSTADMSRVVRYSLLVASPDRGAVMLQAAPPPR